MAILTKMVGFLVTTDAARATAFFRDTLGFALTHDDDFALVFDANGTTLRVTKAREHTRAHGTVLGWQVDDIDAAVAELSSRGVTFEQFNLPFMQQDERGIWTTPNGDRVAWFRDPDGNLLSVSQHR